ncbi:SufB/SufD family protein [Pseudodesulfovibrio sp.]|uniref:SufB/SufD family protein n=1 Tax=unclassified Pseudodesulfovibrio TaxID=2661612 RepID=UPI003B003686
MSKVDLSEYKFDGMAQSPLADLRDLSQEDKDQLLMAGVTADLSKRSASYLQMDQSAVHCQSNNPDVEIMDIKDALVKYDGLKEYFWTLVDKDKDEYTRSAYDNLHGGYFIRVKAGAKVEEPIQSCLMLKTENVGQNVHNVVIIEEGAEAHIITGCSVAHGTTSGAHLGISEFFVKKNASLTFTMVHNWSEHVAVRPRSAGLVEEGGTFQNNYVLLKPVKDLQMYPAITLNGENSLARFNSVVVASMEGSTIDMGNRVVMNAPNTRCEIIARTIASGGTIINRGHIGAHDVPSKGHLECQGLILGNGRIWAIPELDGTIEGVELSHEASVGKIAQEEIEYLMARGLDEDEATATIVRGFLNTDIMGLPDKLQQEIDKQIDELQNSEVM